MNTRRERRRKHVSLAVSALMLLVSVAVPALERSDFATEPVAESEHNPGECPTAHDHTVCTQVGANLSAPAEGHDPQAESSVVRGGISGDAPLGVVAVFPEGHPSRAPPLA